MIYLDDLLTFLKKDLEFVKNEFLLMPDGTLIQYNRKGKTVYLHDLKMEDRRVRKSITKDEMKLRNL